MPPRVVFEDQMTRVVLNEAAYVTRYFQLLFLATASWYGCQIAVFSGRDADVMKHFLSSNL